VRLLLFVMRGRRAGINVNSILKDAVPAEQQLVCRPAQFPSGGARARVFYTATRVNNTGRGGNRIACSVVHPSEFTVLG